jgi:hypothetical protein
MIPIIIGLALFATPGLAFVAHPVHWKQAPSRVVTVGATSKQWRVANIEDWDADVSAIASRYLQGKYENCNSGGDDCRAVCDKNDITAVSVLLGRTSGPLACQLASTLPLLWHLV